MLAYTKNKIIDYVELTKPRIVLLFTITGLAAILMEGSLRENPFKMWMIVLGTLLTAASANALNQYLEIDIDQVMERTRRKRPLPQGKLSAQNALFFGLIVGILSVAVLFFFGNLLAAALGLSTILFYVGVYTLWLKRRTPYNIVIGGAAGATAPLIGWAAATGTLSAAAWVLFLIIFFWTPPHFWALALYVKEEYAKASIPMLPVVAGDAVTKKQIFWYSVTLLPLVLVLAITQPVGLIYLIPAALLSLEFIRRTYLLRWSSADTHTTDYALARRTFGYSIVYLLALYGFLILDILLTSPVHAAEKTPAELENVGIQEKLGSQVDLGLTFRNEQDALVPLRTAFDGHKPVLLFMVYYGCPNLCNFFLNGAIESLQSLAKQGWYAGKQFNVVVVSIDPRETPMLALRKKNKFLEDLKQTQFDRSWNFWVDHEVSEPDLNMLSAVEKNETKSHVKTLANMVGFGYKYDKSQNQFAHSAAMIFLTPGGKVSRYLYGINFKPSDLRLALVEASGSKIGSVVDRLMLYCYNYDPKTKKYSFYLMNIMRAAVVLTFLILTIFLVRSWRRSTMGQAT